MDYCTPQDFFDELNQEFHFTLDAAATAKSAKCPKYYTPETDGLKSPWSIAGGGAVFCNPPYGRKIGKWVRKAYEESRNGTTVVLLIPARTDTAYFHDYIYGCAEIRFVRGRLHFSDEDGNTYDRAPFPLWQSSTTGIRRFRRESIYRISALRIRNRGRVEAL